jgi:hypothetical protein
MTRPVSILSELWKPMLNIISYEPGVFGMKDHCDMQIQDYSNKDYIVYRVCSLGITMIWRFVQIEASDSVESFGSKINIGCNGKSLKEPVTFSFYGNAGVWDKQISFILKFAQMKKKAPPVSGGLYSPEYPKI